MEIPTYFQPPTELVEAATQGDATAQNKLGLMYYDGEDGIRKDFQEAAKWWKLAAEQGLVMAQYNLGVMYGSGIGVEQDAQQAVKWYKLAAKQGSAEAQSMLAVRYVKGEGVGQDFQQAAKWFTQAAEQGDAMAQSALGIMHIKSEGNLEGNLVMAHMWFNVAAATGDTEAAQARDNIAQELTMKQIVEAKERASECLRKIEVAKRGLAN